MMKDWSWTAFKACVVVTVVSSILAVVASVQAQTKPDVMQTTLALLGACNVNLELTRQQALTWERVKLEVEAMNPKTTFDIETKRITPRP